LFWESTGLEDGLGGGTVSFWSQGQGQMIGLAVVLAVVIEKSWWLTVKKKVT
jgi:hypothetical protein